MGATCIKIPSPASSRQPSHGSQGSNGGPKVSDLAVFYEEQNPNASFEEILRQLSRGGGNTNTNTNTNTVSGWAAHYEGENPNATFDEILQMITARRRLSALGVAPARS
jgi:hypothetical protein